MSLNIDTPHEAVHGRLREAPIWKRVRWAEDYFVSHTGLVKSLKHGKERLLAPQLCGNHVRGGYARQGHLIVRLYANGKPRKVYLHRLVAEAFLPPPAENQGIVRHLDDDPYNNHVSNLAWGTPKDNYRDAVLNGRLIPLYLLRAS